jgi:hypothetical protein
MQLVHFLLEKGVAALLSAALQLIGQPIRLKRKVTVDGGDVLIDRAGLVAREVPASATLKREKVSRPLCSATQRLR